MTDPPPRPLLVAVLTVVAASTDAISYLGLHKVFPANMTGNTVLLAVDTAKDDYASTYRSLVALGGFVVGAVLAGAVIGSGQAAITWRRSRLVLAVELAALLATLSWWLAVATPPLGARQLASIGLLGLAMGAQSGVVAQAGIAVSTTYITGTWTTISTYAGRAVRRAAQPQSGPQGGPALAVLVVGCYLAAAFAAGFLFHAEGGRALALPCAALAAALVLTTVRAGPPSPP